VLLKVRNSGVNASFQPSLFIFTGMSTQIQWPQGIVTWPINGQSQIYTILRFMDEPDGSLSCFGTYSNPYKSGNIFT